MQRHHFGMTPEGDKVEIFVLENRHGIRARIMTYGGIVVSLEVPDKNKNRADIVLGYDRLESYLERNPYFGAIIGRYANRIAKARFTLNGVKYTLAANNGENSLHGGRCGFDKQIWTLIDASQNALALRYVSPDGEEGYPGELTTTVAYSLSEKNELRIDYSAVSNQDTIINLTNHSWFNLAGAGNGDILEHQLQIHARRFTPVGPSLIPTGELWDVTGTPFDFTSMKSIGSGMDTRDEQIRIAKGYDHNFVLDGNGALNLAATLDERRSGRKMEVLTTQPGLQFFSGNTLDGSIRGKADKVYGRHAALCLETQNFPDAPNHSNFPSAILHQGQTFQSTTIYRFSTLA
ncbi:MAG TPA: aldose epimerase family protein [Terriglobales bacterium]|nr:aldose epimerase family protein [Terriglobales bacterium]